MSLYKYVLTLLTLILSLNLWALPYRINNSDYVTITADGSLIPIQTTYDATLDYSKVYSYKNLALELVLKSLTYPSTGEFKLSKESIEDLDYIKDKIQQGDALTLIIGLQAFTPLLGTKIDVETLFNLYSTDWEQLGQLLSKDIPQIIKVTIIKDLNWILFKSITHGRSKSDINFWRSMLMAWQYANLDNLLGVYTGSAVNPEMPDLAIDVRLEINLTMDNSFTGNLMIKIGGRGNMFPVKRISISENNIVQFENETYGRKNKFEGFLEKIQISNFCSYLHQTKIWCTTLKKIQ